MFLAWVVGAILHSQYLLREYWRRAVGIDNDILQAGVKSLAPHVLSFAALLLFGYGVACLPTVARRLAWGVWSIHIPLAGRVHGNFLAHTIGWCVTRLTEARDDIHLLCCCADRLDYRCGERFQSSRPIARGAVTFVGQ